MWKSFLAFLCYTVAIPFRTSRNYRSSCADVLRKNSCSEEFRKGYWKKSWQSHFLNKVFSLYKRPTVGRIYKQQSGVNVFVISNYEKFYLRYLNFQPSFKVRCCHARVFYRSQIPFSIEGLELQTSLIQCSYLAH